MNVYVGDGDVDGAVLGDRLDHRPSQVELGDACERTGKIFDFGGSIVFTVFVII